MDWSGYMCAAIASEIKRAYLNGDVPKDLARAEAEARLDVHNVRPERREEYIDRIMRHL